MGAHERIAGDLLDRRYRLVDGVKHGQLGCVYKAVHVGLGITVALRVLPIPADSGQSDSVRAQFVREARRAVWLSHPNLPRIHDFFCARDAGVLVTDYVEGETLAERASRRRHLPLADVVRYGQQLCDVLGYLHTQDPPIFCCDITPSDVVIAADGHLWLEGVGIARQRTLYAACDVPSSGRSGHAVSGWQGPHGRLPDQTDLNALGNLLHFLCDDDKRPSLQTACSPEPHAVPAVLRAWRRLMRRALSDDPADRFASAEEFRVALDDVARALAADGHLARWPSWHAIESTAVADSDATSAPRLFRTSARTARGAAAREFLGFRERAASFTPHVTRDIPTNTPAERSLAEQPTTTLVQTVAQLTPHRRRRRWTLRALCVAGAALVALGGVVMAASLGLATGASPRQSTVSGLLRSSGDGLDGTPAARMLGGLLGSPPPPAGPAPVQIAPPARKSHPTNTPAPRATAPADAIARPGASASPIPEARARSTPDPKGRQAPVSPPTLHSSDAPTPGAFPPADTAPEVMIAPVEAHPPASPPGRDAHDSQQSDNSIPTGDGSVGHAPDEAPQPAVMLCRSPGRTGGTHTAEGSDPAHDKPMSESLSPPAAGQDDSSAHHTPQRKQPDAATHPHVSVPSSASPASC